MYNIHCVVQGGVTGRREALLKRGDGEVQEFSVKEVAQEEASRLNKEMNGPYSTASFRYTVIPA